MGQECRRPITRKGRGPRGAGGGAEPGNPVEQQPAGGQVCVGAWVRGCVGACFSSPTCILFEVLGKGGVVYFGFVDVHARRSDIARPRFNVVEVPSREQFRPRRAACGRV